MKSIMQQINGYNKYKDVDKFHQLLKKQQIKNKIRYKRMYPLFFALSIIALIITLVVMVNLSSASIGVIDNTQKHIKRSLLMNFLCGFGSCWSTKDAVEAVEPPPPTDGTGPWIWIQSIEMSTSYFIDMKFKVLSHTSLSPTTVKGSIDATRSRMQPSFGPCGFNTGDSTYEFKIGAAYFQWYNGYVYDYHLKAAYGATDYIFRLPFKFQINAATTSARFMEMYGNRWIPGVDSAGIEPTVYHMY